MIKVMVVEDNDLVRDSLVDLLGTTPGFSVTSECCDGDEVLEAARRFRPDVVLMDIILARVDGLEATRRLLAEDPGSRVVLLTGYVSTERVRQARQMGVDGFQLKDGEPAELLDAIRTVAAGGSAWTPAVEVYLRYDS